MRQFICGSDAAFLDLEERARSACLRFADRELPSGCLPPRAAVGFQVDPGTGAATLYVERGVHYSGANAEIAAWCREGERRFPDFRGLQSWLQGPVAAAYTEAVDHGAAVPHEPRRPADLTDLQAVRGRNAATAVRVIDEEALFRALCARVRGQDGTLRTLSRRTCQHLSRRSPRRPATFFSVGPTGVGKTASAEALPQALRALDPECSYAFLRLDMNEYAESHRVSQLLGAPQGYTGHGEGAQLIDALVANPRTVVLFDEIEKAHPDILKALMNAMDAGRLSSPSKTEKGREVDCRQALFLFTSNLEAQPILDDLAGAGTEASPAVVDDVCRNRLRAAGIAPELIGRIGTFLVFRPLEDTARAEVVALTVVRVAEEYGVTVHWIDPVVISQILDETRSSRFGVRPYEYLVDDLLGGAFLKTAAAGDKTPQEVLPGNPFTCRPLSAADRKPLPTAVNTDEKKGEDDA